MIQERVSNNVERVGVVKKTACSIMVNAKAFELLARQYSNPVKAIIQELSANAVDSHIRANKLNVPFKVKLPNSLDPHFKIRDFGVSMSPDTIYDVYINYMKSDKDNTNSEVGCFGIGSKTPFAYTDSFNVTTFLNGVKRMYTMSYNEIGVPELNEYESVKTTEENGVEIGFAVKEKDFHDFTENAKHVFKFFEQTPIVVGNPNFVVPSTKILQGTNWYYTNSNENTSYVVMGNIAYPISSYNINYDKRGILNSGVIFTIPIGEANITPSRESLEYTDKTKKNIAKALETIEKELEKAISDKIATAKTRWEASLKAKELLYKFDFIKSNTIRWNGKTVYEFIKIPVSKTMYLNSNGRIKNETIRDEHNVPASNDTEIIIIDEQKKSIAKLRHHIHNNGKKRLIAIDPTHFDAKAENIYSDIVTVYGIGAEDGVISYISDLENPPKVVRAKTTRRKNPLVSFRTFSPSRNGEYRRNRYDVRYWLGTEEKEITDTFLYVEFCNYTLKFKGIDGSEKEISTTDFADLYNAITDSGVKIPTLHGVNSQKIAKVQKNANAIEFFEWVRPILNSEKFISSLVASMVTNNVDSSVIENICNVAKDCTSDLVIKTAEVLSNYRTKKNVSSTVTFWVNAITGMEITKEAESVKTKIHNLLVKLRTKYFSPMYVIENHRYFDNKIAKTVAREINSLDKV